MRYQGSTGSSIGIINSSGPLPHPRQHLIDAHSSSTHTPHTPASCQRIKTTVLVLHTHGLAECHVSGQKHSHSSSNPSKCQGHIRAQYILPIDSLVTKKQGIPGKAAIKHLLSGQSFCLKFSEMLMSFSAQSEDAAPARLSKVE